MTMSEKREFRDSWHEKLRSWSYLTAFPASDIGLLRGVAKVDGAPSTPIHLLCRAESWRPWRAYAAQHLWAANATQIPSVEGTYA
jgi:AraC family transcriptional regulator of adaptative response / DNA-3-methyladenine glycosylase II